MIDRIQIPTFVLFLLLCPIFRANTGTFAVFAQTGDVGLSASTAPAELPAIDSGAALGTAGTGVSAGASSSPGYGTLDTPVLMERYSPDPTPPDGYEALNLVDILNRACDSNRARAAATVYWRSVRAASDWKYYRQLSEQLKNLAGTSDPLALLYIRKTADRTSEAQLRMRRRAIDLTVMTGPCSVPGSKLSYGVELPHIGRYQTNLDQIARYRGISPEVRLLDKQIALDFEQIKAAASALAASMYYSEALWELLRQGKTTTAELVSGLEQEDKCREDFWDGIIRYNDDITAFALWSSRFQPYRGESLAKLLILSPQPAKLPLNSGRDCSGQSAGTNNSTFVGNETAGSKHSVLQDNSQMGQNTQNGQYAPADTANNYTSANNGAYNQGAYDNSAANVNQYQDQNAANNNNNNYYSNPNANYQNNQAGGYNQPGAAAPLPSNSLPADQYGSPAVTDPASNVPSTAVPVPSTGTAPTGNLPTDIPTTLQPSEVLPAPSLDFSRSTLPTAGANSAAIAANVDNTSDNPIQQVDYQESNPFRSGAGSASNDRTASDIATLELNIPDSSAADENAASAGDNQIPLSSPGETTGRPTAASNQPYQTYYTPQTGSFVLTSNTGTGLTSGSVSGAGSGAVSGAEQAIDWFNSSAFKRAGDCPVNLKEYLTAASPSQYQDALGDYWRATVERQRLAAAYTALRRAEAIQNQMLPNIQSENNSVKTSMFYLSFNAWKQTLLAETARAEANLIHYQFRMARWMNRTPSLDAQNSLPWPTTPFQSEAYRITSQNLSNLANKDRTLDHLTGSVALEYEQAMRSRNTLAQAQNLVKQTAQSSSVRAVIQMLQLEYQTAVDQLEQTAQYNFTLASYVQRWLYVRGRGISLDDYCNSLVSKI